MRWAKQYRFTLIPRQLADYAPTCRYHQTSPDSRFTRKRICSMATPNGRVSLDDHRLILTEDGQRQERPVSQDECRSILADRFGIVLDE